jgi:GGDEF domain-containing protein
VISIRRYLQADQKTGATLLPLVQLLIEGIEKHSVEGAPGELAHLRESTQRMLDALDSGAPLTELLDLGASAIDALKQHNLHVVEYLRGKDVELQAKVRLLTDCITSVSSSSSENMRRLGQIKSQLLSTLDVKQIYSVRERLSRCLDSVLVEAERQRSEVDRATEQLNRPSQRLNVPGDDGADAGEAPTADAATGLPARAQAENAIAQCCQDEGAAFVAIMVINQVETLNRSLGGQSGDVILQRFAGFVRQQLPSIDQVFRWSGPTVVALLRRRSAREVRSVIEPLLLQRLTVKIVNPDVQVPVSARWTVLPLMASPRLLFQKMDVFAGMGTQTENSDYIDP